MATVKPHTHTLGGCSLYWQSTLHVYQIRQRNRCNPVLDLRQPRLVRGSAPGFNSVSITSFGTMGEQLRKIPRTTRRTSRRWNNDFPASYSVWYHIRPHATVAGSLFRKRLHRTPPGFVVCVVVSHLPSHILRAITCLLTDSSRFSPTPDKAFRSAKSMIRQAFASTPGVGHEDLVMGPSVSSMLLCLMNNWLIVINTGGTRPGPNSTRRLEGSPLDNSQ